MTEQSQKLSDFFTHSRRKGRAGLPLMSVTTHDGLVRRDALDRKTDSALVDEEHLLVEPGDIAYNMMRMWQGALGLADSPANVSPAYGVMRPRDSVDPRFAKHWFKSGRGLYMLWAYSYGLTNDRLRLYPKEFLRIPVEWPEVADQSARADVLDMWDHALDVGEKLHNSLAERERFVLQSLVELPDAQIVTLGDIGQFVKGKGLAKEDITDTGVACLRYAEIYTLYDNVTEHLHSRTSEISAKSARGLKRGDVVIATSGETAEEIGKALAYMGSDPAFVGGDTVLLTEHGQNGAYLAHVLNSPALVRQKMAVGQGHSVVHILTRDLAKLTLPLPPIGEQRRIATILDYLRREREKLRLVIQHIRSQKRGVAKGLLLPEGDQRSVAVATA